MGRKILLTGLIIVFVCGVSALPASASTPTITKFKPSSATIGTEVTIKGTNLAGATKVTFNGINATVISDKATKIEAEVPAGATTGYIKVKTPGGTGTSASKFTVLTPLVDVTSVASDSEGYCALLTSGGVDCWGFGEFGELGNGTFSNSATPVTVVGLGGTGTLTGVKSLVGSFRGFCALLTSRGVDCWGYGPYGELGNGTFTNSDTPVAVEGVGGTGTLTGVKTLVGGDLCNLEGSIDDCSYCALLTTSGVDCWGNGYYGQLGNGTFYTTGNEGSATPVVVEGAGGTGTLTGVTSLTADFDAYCALLTSSGVDCWGAGFDGQLGDGTFSNSATPVAVVGVGGTGTLTGVTSLIADLQDYCALLNSGGVDCWGNGYYGQLGNGTFYTTGNEGSATPVVVEAVGGSGALTGVTSVVSDSSGYCAVLATDRVDCWGYGYDGELGNGTFYTSGNEGSATPVVVEGVGGTGILTGVTSLVSDLDGYCALLTSSGVDCWGSGEYGELGNGTFYTTGNQGSAAPVVVEGIGGSGTLTGVTSLATNGGGYCALLTSAGLDCWGSGEYGELGNGSLYMSSPYGSATPVEVG